MMVTIVHWAFRKRRGPNLGAIRERYGLVQRFLPDAQVMPSYGGDMLSSSPRQGAE